MNRPEKIDTQTAKMGGTRQSYYSLKLEAGTLRPRYWPTWLGLALLRMGALLPFGVSRHLGAGLGWLMMALNAKRRRIARINLAMCFPELTPGKRERLLRRHFAAAGQSYLDMAHLAWAPRRTLEAKTHFVGLDHYQTQIASGRSVILLAPHCLGMNFGGSLIARQHPQFSMIKAQRNPLLNWFLNKGRMRFGCFLLVREQGLRPAVRGLRQGLTFYYLPDEDFGPERSVFVPFFGIPTATLTTSGRLAGLAPAAVVPCFTRLLPGGRGYEVILKPALENFPSGDQAADAARINQALEAGIREMPEQYMWTFRLFKTRPGGEPSPYG